MYIKQGRFRSFKKKTLSQVFCRIKSNKKYIEIFFSLLEKIIQKLRSIFNTALYRPFYV